MKWLVVALVVVGCDQDAGKPGVNDLSVALRHDLAVAGDLSAPSACNPVDPMSDGQACGTGCAAGTFGVTVSSGCHCFQKCDPLYPTTCPCDRRCATLVSGDAGVVGGACLKANGPGERCGQSGVSGDNALGCAQGLYCVNADDAAMFRYCVYDCATASCPIQTSCLTLVGGAGKACAFDSVTGGLAPGATCQPNDSCQTGYLCDGTCKPQCDRAGATCATGTCTALSDGARVVGYVCK
jgi:hypothetical protein